MGPIALQIGMVTVNGELKVGSSTQVVEVNSDAPILKTEDAQVVDHFVHATVDRPAQRRSGERLDQSPEAASRRYQHPGGHQWWRQW